MRENEMLLASEASDEASRQSSMASEASREVGPPTPEQVAKEIFDRVLAKVGPNASPEDRLKESLAELYRRGWDDGLERAALKMAAWKDEAERQGMPAARQRWENAETAIRFLKRPIATG